MRALPKPLENFSDVFDLCVAGVGDATLQQRYNEILADLTLDANAYDAHGVHASWWTIPQNNQRKNDVVVGRVQKGELKALYSNYLAAQGKPARGIYDKLMGAAPGEKCPYCGIGRVATLDHYLPKSKFPRLSILVTNLVPSCRDCNLGGKGVAVATSEGDQPIHPYFDADTFNSVQWLFCEIHETRPATVSFYAGAPKSWSSSAIARVNSHLRAFDLNARFSVEAAEELSNIRQTFICYFNNASANERSQQLKRMELIESRLHMNSWKRALYQALANSGWFCDEGFL
ncbi:hypothetical protein GO594_30115 [Pseudomonas otitidis]|uniref:HNH endonuclease n=1 Tax=Metapseudomonas otitidis TaxID=319939 RepID=A0A679GR05_9GAMM|nr:HNH endonuclease [Pseudomonas otitidis]MWK60245.1 hypothetical protein [Pseudomonas otitidis]BCA30798.1 HNH endonuclease [Pseudomonas otitidis]